MNDERFDARIRAAHDASLAHLSARTRAQLQQRRRAALADASREAPTPLRFAWPVAMACVLGVLAIALHLRPAAVAPPAAGTPVVAAASTTAPPRNAVLPANGDTTAAYAALDESPDLYVWMASDDAAALAME
jgi:hypothetical protein